MDVYLLQHLHILPNDNEEIKLIGIYSSKDQALNAYHQIQNQPGFKNFDKIYDHDKSLEDLDDDLGSGFHLEKIKLDKTSWKEGFVTL